MASAQKTPQEIQKELINVTDIKHALTLNKDSMIAVRKFAAMEDVTLNEAIKILADMINASDATRNSVFYQLSLKKDENEGPVFENYVSFSDVSKSFTFGLGPATITLNVTFNPSTLTISVDAQVKLVGRTILSRQIGSLSIGQSVSLNASIYIASATLTLTFGKWYINASISGYIGVKPFGHGFGPYNQRISLPFGGNENDLQLKKSEEKEASGHGNNELVPHSSEVAFSQAMYHFDRRLLGTCDPDASTTYTIDLSAPISLNYQSGFWSFQIYNLQTGNPIGWFNGATTNGVQFSLPKGSSSRRGTFTTSIEINKVITSGEQFDCYFAVTLERVYIKLFNKGGKISVGSGSVAGTLTGNGSGYGSGQFGTSQTN